MDPADRLVCRWLAAIGLALALAVAIGLAVGSFVVAGRHEARIRQEPALAWEENAALSARQEALRGRAVALRERLAANLERGPSRAFEENAAR
jgi:hypothetical protein